MVQLLGKTLWWFLKKLKIELLYDSAVSLLGMSSKEWKPRSQRTISRPMLKVALFTIAKTWDHSKSPRTDEWISKMWYRHSMEYYSGINLHIPQHG